MLRLPVDLAPMTNDELLAGQLSMHSSQLTVYKFCKNVAIQLTSCFEKVRNLQIPPKFMNLACNSS